MGSRPCLPQGLLRYLHVGDFRWTAAMAEEPALQGLPLDILFLDTTYSNPRHTHPPQVRPVASWLPAPSLLANLRTVTQQVEQTLIIFHARS